MDFADNRPDPDELLASLKFEEEKSKRGKLKIFFRYVCRCWKNIYNASNSTG